MTTAAKTLTVQATSGDYPIVIGKRLDWASWLTEYVTNKQVMVVSNETVAPLYMSRLQDALGGASAVQACILPDGEQYKVQKSIDSIYDALMENAYNRDCVVIALGGGVVGDMAGFAAASFQRGVDFIQIPTTVLSQVDSSVGGKTGINHALGKNMIGAFKQPKLVLIDIEVLQTLPEREVSAGLAEVIKYALIADTEFLAWLEQHMSQLTELDADSLIEAIYRSCEHKAKIVNEDEFEAGRRALLNLGHTFGHAIENHMGYGEWLHGEAVAVGTLQACVLSQKLGWLNADDTARVAKLLHAAKLPTAPPKIPAEASLKLMQRDKKVKAGKIRLVLLKALGDAVLYGDVERQLLLDVLNHDFATNQCI